MQSTQRIKFITDSASDIPDDLLLEYDIDMLSVPITIDGQGYFERRSFTIQEFYKRLAQCDEIPKTSRVPADDYVKAFERAFNKGFTDIIVVTINAGGSGTYESALMAAELFFSDKPDAKGKIEIHVVDSKTYTMAYGFPVVEAASFARTGKSVDEILEYLRGFFDSCEIYLACYTLEYAKKSGRINAAAAFVGEVLGLRPIISLIDGETKIVERVRGEKQLLQQLIKCYEQSRGDKDTLPLVICGEVDEHGISVQQALQKGLDHEIPMYNAGASIVCNAGPKIAAIIFRGKKRS